MGLTAKQIADAINLLTGESQRLQAPAQSITILNGQLIVIGLGPYPQIITGLAGIVTSGTQSVAQLQGSAKITADADTKAVTAAFQDFTRVHQVLLNILIGKAGLFSTTPLIGAPVAQALRQVEGIVDTLAFGIVDLIPDAAAASEISNRQKSLDQSLAAAIAAYSGLEL